MTPGADRHSKARERDHHPGLRRLLLLLALRPELGAPRVGRFLGLGAKFNFFRFRFIHYLQNIRLSLFWSFFKNIRISNFSELVLLCIEADFCTQIRIFQHFSRSTRFSHFCTAFICKIRFKHRSKFCKNCTFFVNFHYFCSKSTFFAPILMNFSRNFTDFQYSRVDIR